MTGSGSHPKRFHPSVGVRGWLAASWLCAAAILGLAHARAQAPSEPTPANAAGVAYLVDIQGPIGPATRDFVTGSLERAASRGAQLVVLRMDTPGGLDASTRDIIKGILDSAVPVVTWVAPPGARATSAGTYILYASHVAAMSEATHVGAATPVSMIGGQPPPERDTPSRVPAEDDAGADADDAGDGGEERAEDSSATPPPADTMSRKAINDSVAYLRSLARLRGRNEDWAERAVRDAESLTSEEALELGVIDLMAEDLDDLLAAVDGRVVHIHGEEMAIQAGGLVVERLEPDWRSRLLAVITSPTIAYVLLLMGVYGLLLEGYSPGAILPGVVGAICLLLALYALQMLPVNYAGLALIALGVLLMIAEVMAPSFGVLGIGGVIAMVIGSIILIDTDVPGLEVSRPLIGGIAVAASLGLMALVAMLMKARGRPVVSGREELLGSTGVAPEGLDGEGHVFVHGEVWSAVAETSVAPGQAVIVTAVDGLKLHVRPLEPNREE